MNGAGVLITFVKNGTRYVLTGKESVYLKDTHPTVTLRGVSRNVADDLEKVSKSQVPDKEKVKASFINRAKGISDVIGQRVQFSQVIDEGDKWTTTYRILRDGTKFGIPKGHKESTDTDLKATAVREAQEEIGMTLHKLVKFDVPNIPYEIYRLDIAAGEEAVFMKAITSRMDRHYSELFEIEFRPIDTIAPTNMITRKTLERLAAVGGKTRRRHRKLKRKTRKVRA